MVVQKPTAIRPVDPPFAYTQFTDDFTGTGDIDVQLIEVKSMQRSGTEATRTQLQPSKPKREITNITSSQNTKRTYSQPSEQLFPKRWSLSNRNRNKHNMSTRKVKLHGNSNTKNR